jgi:hypothetical protein
MTATMHITPTVGPGMMPWAFAGHAFEVELESASPIAAVVTVNYRPSEVRAVSDLGQLMLRRWDGTAWQDAAASCSPASLYTRNLAASTLSIPICEAGRYALFGPTNRVFSPGVFR